MSRNYVPRPDADASLWFTRFLAGLAGSPALYKITQPELDALAAAIEPFPDSLHVATDPATRTRPAVIAKNEARRVAERAIQWTYNRIKLDPTIPAEAKVDIGIRLTRPPQPGRSLPDRPPNLWIASVSSSTHELQWNNNGTAPGRSLPEGVIGVLLVRAIADEPVGDLARMPFVGVFTRPRIRVAISARDDGQIASYAACWINRRGRHGAWSGLVSHRIATTAPANLTSIARADTRINTLATTLAA